MANTTPTDIVNSVLQILRGQRDDKGVQRLSGTWDLDPKIFNQGPHYVVGPIEFKAPFSTRPEITFGETAQQATENITTLTQPTGYTPLIVHPYVWGFQQTAGLIKAFYIGLYALTPVPSSNIKYWVSWMAEGKGSQYSQQRTDEAWSHSYNHNHAAHLVNETNQSDNQG